MCPSFNESCNFLTQRVITCILQSHSSIFYLKNVNIELWFFAKFVASPLPRSTPEMSFAGEETVFVSRFINTARSLGFSFIIHLISRNSCETVLKGLGNCQNRSTKVLQPVTATKALAPVRYSTVSCMIYFFCRKMDEQRRVISGNSESNGCPRISRAKVRFCIARVFTWSRKASPPPFLGCR